MNKKERVEVCLIDGNEKTEDIFEKIKEKFLADKCIVLNLNPLTNQREEENIISFINKNYKDYSKKIGEKVFVISSQIYSERV